MEGQEGTFTQPRNLEVTTLEICPMRNVLDRSGNGGSLLTLETLILKPKRFTVLQRPHDISQRMLTQTVRQLEQDGFYLKSKHAAPKR